MRIVIQRVTQASVKVEGKTLGTINDGLMLLVAVEDTDTEDDLKYAVRKISNMRIFTDEAGKMNQSVIDIGGSILSISQFTLYADLKKGNRPGFSRACAPAFAEEMYHRFNELLSQEVPVQTGEFGADMQVELLNDGPVTIIFDTAELR